MAERRKDTKLETSGKERRKIGERRDSHRVPLKVWVGIEEKGTPAVCYQGNVGLGGVRFLTGVRYSPGESVDVEFELPGVDHDFKIKSRVVDVRREKEGFAVGVRFSSLEFDEERLLARFLDRYAKS